MKHLGIFLACVVWLWPVLAFGDGEQPRTISVSGTATIHVKPDFATVDVGSFAKSSSAVQAKRQCDKAMAQAVAAIRKLGLKADDITTTDYSVFPVRAREGGPLAWKVVESAEVKVRNLALVADVIDTAVSNGAPEVMNVQFGLDEAGPARAKARELAVAAAKAKAEALAQMLGVELGDVQSVSEQPWDEMSPATTSNMAVGGDFDSTVAQAPISAGQQSVRAMVNLVYTIK
jgi:hypothetical protein